MNKLAHLITNLSYNDLTNLQKDLRSGNLDKIINKRMQDIKPTNNQICPVCNADIPEDNFTLVFGPSHLRQRASFDGLDCLDYFLEKIKRQQATRNEQPV